MVSHSSILAWRIPWTEEPGGIQFMGSQRVGKDWSNLGCMHAFLGFNHQGTDSNLNGLNIKKHTPGYIRVKLLTTKDQINLFKREKKIVITYKGTTFRLTSNFLKEKMNETTKKIWLTFYFCFQYSIYHGFLKRLNLCLFINILRFIKSKVALWRNWIVWQGHIREIWINHFLILKTLLTLLQIYCSKGSYFIFKYICVSNCMWENTLWSLLGWLGFFKLPLYLSGSKALEVIFLLLAHFFFF